MIRKFLRYSALALCCLTAITEASDKPCLLTIQTPKYCGGTHGGFTWLYLQSGASDGDLEAGSLISLSGDPNSLFAQLQELRWDNRSAYRANTGYSWAGTNCSMDVDYLHFDGHGGSRIGPLGITQLIQNYLGGAFANMLCYGSQRLNQVDVLFGKEYIINHSFSLRPFWGVKWADIDRKLFVRLDDFRFTTDPSNVSARLHSHYWGVGPTVGTDFCYPIVSRWTLEGRLGVSVLTGRLKADISSAFVDGTDTTRFDAAAGYTRVVPTLNTQVALCYRPCRQVCGGQIEWKFGYQSDYYFKAVDHVNPYRGYVVDTDPSTVKSSSNLGLGGPFISVGYTPDEPRKYYGEPVCCTDACHPSGWLKNVYAEVDLIWLKPIGDNDDLVFATATTADGNQHRQKVGTDHNLSVNYRLGYRRTPENSFQVNLFKLQDQYGSRSITAPGGGFLRSIDSSGNAFIDYANASSKVYYGIDQVDAQIGKLLSISRRLRCELLFGARYAHIRRKLHNTYSGGTPDAQFASKQADLKSDYHGVGPMFGTHLSKDLSRAWQWDSYCSLTMFLGQVRSRLSQQNQGTDGTSSNTLQTPWTHQVVPMIDVATGLTWKKSTRDGSEWSVGAGYQYKHYYRAINLVYPTFLTGLQQRNSDLALHGPYVSVQLNNF